MLSTRAPLFLALLSTAACAATPVAPASAPPPPSPLTPPSTPSPTAYPLAARIDPLFAGYTKPGSPGCAVGVYRAGEIVFARGYGAANLEQDIPIDRASMFETGSVSKQFTAMAIALLVQDGKVSLDDDVRKYVSELPVYGKPITLAHMLHHTSGLRDYDALLAISGFALPDVTNDDDALHVIAHQKALNFPTGTEWSYSNTGYFLASIVVKRVTGKTLAQFAKERIFDPLGMTHTFYLDDHTRIVPHRATAYAPRNGGGFGIEMSDWEQVGDGSVQTSIDDLARWDANFYEPKVGGAAALAMIRTPGKLDDGKPLTYAMGLEETTTNGVPREEHGGAWAGYRAQILRFPTEKLTVACLCNVADADPGELADNVATLLLPKLASTASATSTPTPTPTPTPLPPTLTPIVGSYYDPTTFEVRTFSLSSGAITLGFGLEPGGPTRPLSPIDDHTLVVLDAPRATATTYRFEPATRRAPAHAIRTPTEGKPSTYVRFEPSTPTAADLADYAGRYESDEVVRATEIAVVDGKLVLGEWGRTLGPDTMHPLMRDLFTFGGAGIKFERDARGKVRGFVLSANRMVGMVFTKRESPSPKPAPKAPATPTAAK